MDEDSIADLKQFIAGQFAQQAVKLKIEWQADIRAAMNELEERLMGNLGAKIDDTSQKLEQRLTRKIDNLSAAVAEAIEGTNEATDEQLKDHERRIVRLEHKTA